jgi:hypothetical protein
VSVRDGVVELESLQGRGTFSVDRADFERAATAPGSQVIAVDKLAEPLPLDVAPVAARVTEDGTDGSDLARNLLIGGMILLPAAGAATYFATRKTH